ncbi:hypothetical protein BDP55DRAFT_46908 [Colletotrichum godetiae]|uniref:Uncharacterized protein n=1 Tax=Colletotrichum godetiae TaxID=1209918 RepID=A0AAJ0AQH5_9PEZI|nr:uncharacterized protein BDP55DRAFT_46908 [Colletotrichum godetiae]KAK1688507.1 hypothetical protein BDP55DRAFT_46908 [Colletotrichum godetiae]
MFSLSIPYLTYHAYLILTDTASNEPARVPDCRFGALFTDWHSPFTHTQAGTAGYHLALPLSSSTNAMRQETAQAEP